MQEMSEINGRVSPAFFWRGQMQHILLLCALGPGTWYWIKPGLTGNELGGIVDQTWVLALFWVVIAQHIAGWLVFRAQICWGLLSRWFGNYDLIIWGLIFIPLLIARVGFFVLLAVVDRQSLLQLPLWLGVTAGILLLIPGLYALWSVQRHFGLVRAMGGDHFRAEYRQMPLVRAGIFRFSDNGMYTFAFTLFWGSALLFQSRAALLMALFQHAYIWVHMAFTEAPDMKVLYGDS